MPITGEPTVQAVRDGVQQARFSDCDVVIGFGGGSAIDAGKAIAALLANGSDPLDYLEVIGKGHPLALPSFPFIAIPTTARHRFRGDTQCCSRISRARRQGKPAKRPHAARLAVVDPELALHLPPEITASTGLDALTQLIEPYVSVRANALTDGFCLEGMHRAAVALRRAWLNPEDIEARTDMALASLMSGLALANSGLGAVHGFAAPIGGMFPAPHGAICAALLPSATRINIQALRSRSPNNELLQRYETVAAILTGKPNAAAEDAVEWLSETCDALEIPGLETYGIEEHPHFSELAGKAASASSMKGNPIVLTRVELEEILRPAIKRKAG